MLPNTEAHHADHLADIREHDRRVIGGQGYRWPEVGKHTHPAKHRRPPAERREGPRSASWWGGLE